jgi:hypothetical protein
LEPDLLTDFGFELDEDLVTFERFGVDLLTEERELGFVLTDLTPFDFLRLGNILVDLLASFILGLLLLFPERCCLPEFLLVVFVTLFLLLDEPLSIGTGVL